MLGGENILDLIPANFPCLPGLASSSTTVGRLMLPAASTGCRAPAAPERVTNHHEANC